MSNPPYKVLICAMAFPPSPIGPAAYASRLALGLSTKGVEVVVVAPRGEPESCAVFDRGQPYRVDRFHPGRSLLGRYAAAGRCLQAAIRRFAPDSLWTTNGMATRVAGLLPGLGKRVPPLVSCMRGTDIVSHRGRGRFKRLLGASQFRCYRHSVAIAAASDFLKQVALGLGVEGEKIFVNPPGIDLDQVDQIARDPAGLRARYPLLGDGPLVLTVGRLSKQKRVDTCLRAVARLAASHPELCYAVVGDGPERAALERLAARLGLGDRVLFTGALAPMSVELYEFYRRAQICLMAAVGEGLSNFLIETGAFGIPGVGVADGGIPEVLRDGQTGLLATPEDEADIAAQIARLLGDPAWARQLGGAARQRVEQDFSLEALTRRSYGVLEAVVAGRSVGQAVLL
ncbi:MAG: glycosyltransferase [Candidatus Latescibacteria bacterium]|nr:glycosyltransferase [Candidatus Latescibacterota bacterium]